MTRVDRAAGDVDDAVHGTGYAERSEAFLDPAVRGAQSTWNFTATEVVECFVAALARDVAAGTREPRHGHLRAEPSFDGSPRPIVDLPG